ncbi:hypothetical protein QTP70_015561 [Hemibagrus guttatus]|uniref:Semaphorin-7A-like n=1 Tax=Hemibagrus guttatus TaxID=175788 RepID=A0AAE0RBD1_9TELE|nr:hypothetical protein QTP70_015561 [Hemibagrus guttatus]KAK3570641.1 hypothetical protein QTP86_024542 [Hemibagrus guttatus]
MAFRGPYTLLLASLWITVSRPTLGVYQLKPRIIVSRENGAFHTLSTSSGETIGDLKLIQDSHRREIYAGGHQSLFRLHSKSKPPTLTKVNLMIFESKCQNNATSSECKISMLKEGRNGNPLFMCGTVEKNTECCDVTPELLLVNCFSLSYPTQINEPAVHVGDSLYYSTSNSDLSGLYRWAEEKATWPLSGQAEQRHVKILANKGNGSLDGKVYNFYIEQNQNQNPDMPLWIPRVSQICMADLGGPKMVLQFRWTSMLTARLFCGDEKKLLSYTELLDIAVLEAAEWENTTIYALFKNTYDFRAVCVYKMSDIVRVFSGEFKDDEAKTFSSPRPGECVENSRVLSSNFLRFMERRPEMKQWIMPARDPLMFKHNHHYTHLQVDRLRGRKSGHPSYHVLFMSLDNGNVHKILEQEGEPFIIAEYQLYKTTTHISSMLLDRRTRRLFVSSSSEVVQIDLRNCSVYGKHCQSCVMARDPYCGWDLLTCSADNGSLVQDVTHGNYTICENAVPHFSESRTEVKRDHPSNVPQYSRFYLECPMESHHASYAWEHQGRKMKCVSADHNCLLLIDSMSEKDEGVYQCVASENGYDKAIARERLQMNGASETRVTPIALLCLLFLISVIC